MEQLGGGWFYIYNWKNHSVLQCLQGMAQSCITMLDENKGIHPLLSPTIMQVSFMHGWDHA